MACLFICPVSTDSTLTNLSSSLSLCHHQLALAISNIASAREQSNSLEAICEKGHLSVKIKFFIFKKTAQLVAFSLPPLPNVQSNALFVSVYFAF